jgi:hypothetical protein
MNRRPRLDGFLGGDADYILYLESRVLSLQNEIHARSVSPPPSQHQAPSFSPPHFYEHASSLSQPHPQQQLVTLPGQSSLHKHDQSLQPSLSRREGASLQQLPPSQRLSSNQGHASLSGPLNPISSLQSLSAFQPPQLHMTFARPLGSQLPPLPSPLHSVSLKRGYESLDTGTQFIPWKGSQQPPSIDPRKPKKPKPPPRWQIEADRILTEIQQANALESQRTALNLTTWERILAAFDLVVRQAKNSVGHSGKGPLLRQPPASPTSIESLVLLCREYSGHTGEIAADGALETRASCFRQLVIASLCAVMEKEGCPRATVDKIMINDLENESKNEKDKEEKPLSPEYLKLLRYIALWVNRVIVELGVKLGHRASELFLLCKLKVPKVLYYCKLMKYHSCATHLTV